MGDIETSRPRKATKEELDEYGRMAEQWCREDMAKLEAAWTAEGKTFAWFSKEPDWAEGNLSWFFLEDPTAPGKRIFRFSMIGGGQIKTTEAWDWFRSNYNRKDRPDWAKHETWRDDTTYLAHVYPRDNERLADLSIVVTPHTVDGVERYRGLVVSHFSDCSASAVVFPGNVPQEIADRAAATLRLTSRPDIEPFYALLDGSEGCAICGRALRDEVSKLVGVGPDCAKLNGIPHSLGAASKRLELRHKLLRGEP
jgi:hypothetical protein